MKLIKILVYIFLYTIAFTIYSIGYSIGNYIMENHIGRFNSIFEVIFQIGLFGLCFMIGAMVYDYAIKYFKL